MKITLLKILVCLSCLCTLVAAATGLLAYLAVTGLDLLETAKKTLPKVAIALAIAAAVLWIITLIVYLAKNGSRK